MADTFDNRFDLDRLDRQEDLRDEDLTYNPESQLTIPANVKENLYDNGFVTRWVRVFIEGRVDSKNIRKRLHANEGYSFVRPDDLDESDVNTMGGIVELGTFGEAIVNGDLALMKVRLAKNEARKKHFEDKTHQRRQVTENLIRQHSLINNSTGNVTKGKPASF